MKIFYRPEQTALGNVDCTSPSAGKPAEVVASSIKLFPTTEVVILDLDCHYGNGTENIIWRIGVDWIEHCTFGGCGIRLDNAGQWLKDLPEIMVRFAKCDVVLYQAGADPHVNDPLGGILTTEQLYERDRTVFKTLKDMGMPVAWNLAGGYQTPLRKILDLHDNTAHAFLAMN